MRVPTVARPWWRVSGRPRAVRLLSCVPSRDSAARAPSRTILRIRRESLTAGDSWEDLHGTKDRPLKQTLRWARFAKKAKADGETSAAAAADALTDDRRPSVSQRV